MSSNTAAQEAFKTALAVVIAYVVPLWLGWEKPFWAAFAVIMISLDTSGQSLHKGALRILGTFVAAAVALTLVALFPQERWWMVVWLSVYVGWCAYMMLGSSRPYFWFVSAFVVMIVMIDAAPADGLRSFQVVVARIVETGWGILVYSLISALLWPRSSQGDLETASRQLVTTQRQVFRAYRGLLAGQGEAEDTRSMRLEEVRLSSALGQALPAATIDSYQVFEVRRHWRRFQTSSGTLMETLERWRQSFPELDLRHLARALPDLDAVLDELDERLARIESMLGGASPAAPPAPLAITLDASALEGLTHLEKAAVSLTKAGIERLEVLTRSLDDSVRAIRGLPTAPVTPRWPGGRRGGPGVDLERLAAAGQVAAALWIGFLVWVYVDPPGHALFVFMAVQWTLVALLMRTSPSTLLPGFLLGIGLGGVVYVFVMPHLSGFTELGLMLFGVTFLVFWLTDEPRHRGLRTASMAILHVVLGIENQQTYDFAGYANTSAALLMSLALAVTIHYVLTSPRPEKVFLRLLRRFFRQSAFLMARLALDWRAETGRLRRLQAAFYTGSLLKLPSSMAAFAEAIDHRAFPANPPERVRALVSSLQAVALRLEELAELRAQPQSAFLVRQLQDDVRAWRRVVQERFERWARDPASDLDEDRNAPLLAARLATMEHRIGEIYALADTGTLSEDDQRNFYRLLGAYRGLSEAVVEHARLARGIDWASWQERRF